MIIKQKGYWDYTGDIFAMVELHISTHSILEAMNFIGMSNLRIFFSIPGIYGCLLGSSWITYTPISDYNSL